MQQALLEQGMEVGSASEIQTLIEQHVQNQIAEGMQSEQSQKTNLEENAFVGLDSFVSISQFTHRTSVPNFHFHFNIEK